MMSSRARSNPMANLPQGHRGSAQKLCIIFSLLFVLFLIRQRWNVLCQLFLFLSGDGQKGIIFSWLFVLFLIRQRCNVLGD